MHTQTCVHTHMYVAEVAVDTGVEIYVIKHMGLFLVLEMEPRASQMLGK